MIQKSKKNTDVVSFRWIGIGLFLGILVTIVTDQYYWVAYGAGAGVLFPMLMLLAKYLWEYMRTHQHSLRILGIILFCIGVVCGLIALIFSLEALVASAETCFLVSTICIVISMVIPKKGRQE